MHLTKRELAEAGIFSITFARLAVGFLQTYDTGYMVDVMSLLALSIISTLQELSTGPGKAYRYHTRHADSEGLAVGALAAPWAFAGMLLSSLRHRTNSGFSYFALRSSIVSSLTMVAVLAICTECSMSPNMHPQALTRGQEAAEVHQKFSVSPLSAAKGKPRSSVYIKKGWMSGSWIAAAAGCFIFFLISCAPAPGGKETQQAAWEHAYVNGTSAVAGYAINATAAAGSMHLMLTHLPNCFTVGEAMVVAQAIVLLLWDVLVLGLSFAAGLLEAVRPASKRHSSQACGSKELGGLSSILASRSDASLFVELLVFGALLTGLVVSQLLRALHAPAASSQKQDKEPAQGVSVEADGSREAIAADKRKHRGRKRWGETQRRGRRRMVVVGLLVAVLVLAVTAAVRPALWVLQFALSSWRRVALLCYWVLLLAGALPFMDWVAGRVPTIIVRKGYHILAMALFMPALLLEPQMLSMSLAIAAALLVVAEVLRVGNVPVLGPKIHRFMTSFIDSRDAGALLVSHFSLLAGMSAPVWLSAASSYAGGQLRA